MQSSSTSTVVPLEPYFFPIVFFVAPPVKVFLRPDRFVFLSSTHSHYGGLLQRISYSRLFSFQLVQFFFLYLISHNYYFQQGLMLSCDLELLATTTCYRDDFFPQLASQTIIFFPVCVFLLVFFFV